MQNDLFYFNETLKRAITIERFKQHNVNNLNELFKRVDDYMKTLNDLETINESVIAKIKTDLENIYKDFGLQLTATMSQVFIDAYEYEHEAIAEAYPDSKDDLIIIGLAALTALSLKAITEIPLMLDGDKGRLLSSLLDDFTIAESELIANRVRAGVFEGKPIGDIVKEIRGTAQGNYKDGLIETSRRHADALTRTGIQQAESLGRDEFAKRNNGVFDGVQFLAIIDSRTSRLCRSIDRMIVPITDPRRPPFHVNCRTTFIYVVKDRYVDGQPKDRPIKNGDTKNMQYYDWLAQQPASYQDEILGKTRGKLFRDGGLTTKQFSELNINKNFEPLTLDEMRKLRPKAFEKAGL